MHWEELSPFAGIADCGITGKGEKKMKKWEEIKREEELRTYREGDLSLIEKTGLTTESVSDDILKDYPVIDIRASYASFV